MIFDKEIKRFILKECIRVLCIGLIGLIIGTLFTYWVQSRMLIRQQQFEIYKERVSLINDISLLANQRRWWAQRVIWIIKGTAIGEFQDAWEKYYKSVTEWNMNLTTYASRMKLYGCDRDWIDCLVNDQVDGGVVWGGKEPISVHGHFLLTHEKIRKLYVCVKNGCSEEEKKNLIAQAEKATMDMGRNLYDFIDISARKLNVK